MNVATELDESSSSSTSSTSALPDEVLSLIFTHLILSNLPSIIAHQQSSSQYQVIKSQSNSQSQSSSGNKGKARANEIDENRLSCQVSNLHIPSIKSISLISRRYHSLACQFLYHTVYLDSTIKLTRFHRAIALRPNLGNLVKNLFVGNLTLSRLLPDFNSQDHILAQIYSKIFRNQPSNSESDSTLDDFFDYPAALDDQVNDSNSTGPSLTHPALDSNGRNIGLDEWVNRVWLLQMGREMWHVEQKQRELETKEKAAKGAGQNESHGLTSDPLDYGNSSVYLGPVTSSSSSTSTQPQPSSETTVPTVDSYSIKSDSTFHSRLLSYSSSSRRDAISNFNHPVLFARSNASELILGPSLYPEPNLNPNVDQEGNQNLQDQDGNQAQGQGGLNVPNQNSNSSFYPASALFGRTLPSGGRRLGLTDVPISSNSNPSESQHTIGSLISLTRSLLSMCPSIGNLSLNGFLESVVADERSCASLLNLHSLSLGPPPPYWSQPLLFGGPYHPIFKNIKLLHISGCMLFQTEIDSLNGKDGSLPHLQKLIWSLKSSYALDHEIGLIATIEGLLGIEKDPDAFSEEEDDEDEDNDGDKWLKQENQEGEEDRQDQFEEDKMDMFEEGELGEISSSWKAQASFTNATITSSSPSQSSFEIKSRPSKSKSRNGVPFLHAILYPLDVEDFRRNASKKLRNSLRLKIQSCDEINLDLPIHHPEYNENENENGFSSFGNNPTLSQLDSETLKSFQESKLFFQGESLKKDYGDKFAYSNGVNVGLSLEEEEKKNRRRMRKRKERENTLKGRRRNLEQQNQSLNQGEASNSSNANTNPTVNQPVHQPQLILEEEEDDDEALLSGMGD